MTNLRWLYIINLQLRSRNTTIHKAEMWFALDARRELIMSFSATVTNNKQTYKYFFMFMLLHHTYICTLSGWWCMIISPACSTRSRRWLSEYSCSSLSCFYLLVIISSLSDLSHPEKRGVITISKNLQESFTQLFMRILYLNWVWIFYLYCGII